MSPSRLELGTRLPAATALRQQGTLRSSGKSWSTALARACHQAQRVRTQSVLRPAVQHPCRPGCLPVAFQGVDSGGRAGRARRPQRLCLLSALGLATQARIGKGCSHPGSTRSAPRAPCLAWLAPFAPLPPCQRHHAPVLCSSTVAAGSRASRPPPRPPQPATGRSSGHINHICPTAGGPAPRPGLPKLTRPAPVASGAGCSAARGRAPPLLVRSVGCEEPDPGPRQRPTHATAQASRRPPSCARGL